MILTANGELTIADVAKALNVTQETVRRYVREGRLAAHKKRTVGLRKVWIVSKEELLRFSQS